MLGCGQSQFPILYLGLPLIIVKPTKAMYMPLIEKFEKKLGGVEGKDVIKRGLSTTGKIGMLLYSYLSHVLFPTATMRG